MDIARTTKVNTPTLANTVGFLNDKKGVGYVWHLQCSYNPTIDVKSSHLGWDLMKSQLKFHVAAGLFLLKVSSSKIIGINPERMYDHRSSERACVVNMCIFPSVRISYCWLQWIFKFSCQNWIPCFLRLSCSLCIYIKMFDIFVKQIITSALPGILWSLLVII